MGRGKRLTPEQQLDKDMLVLIALPEFRRFLFTVAEKAGIASAAYGSTIDTSSHDGRRSLGIDILRLADDALPVRNPALAPYNALGLAISEVIRLQPQESDDEDEEDQDYQPSR